MLQRIAVVGFLCLFVGCFAESGPARYRVQGQITFDGKPVVGGEVLFTPNGSKGNAGAQGIATITDGKYDTTGSRAPGIGGGPMVVRVTAYSDASGKLLCEYELEAELPKQDTSFDINIPASAVKKKSGSDI